MPLILQAALMRVIHRERKSRLRLRRSRKAFFHACMMDWLAAMNRVESEPRKPFAYFRIFLWRFCRTLPRFTLAIFSPSSFENEVSVFRIRHYCLLWLCF